MNKHNLPWKKDDSADISCVWDSKGRRIANMKPKDAALVLVAVNNFHAMRDALSSLLAATEDQSAMESAAQKARDVLAIVKDA